MQVETATETVRFCVYNKQLKKQISPYCKTKLEAEYYKKLKPRDEENIEVEVHFNERGKPMLTNPDYSDLKMFKDL